MKREVRVVVREIEAVMEKPHLVTSNMLKKWLLLLCPPRIQRREPRNVAADARRTVKKALDDLCRQIIFARDGNACRKCRRTDRQLQWCHVYPKGAHPWLRWDLDNSFCGCSHCHMNWWHAKPEEAMAWWGEQIGESAMQSLRLRAAKPRKTDSALWMLALKEAAKAYGIDVGAGATHGARIAGAQGRVGHPPRQVS